MSFALSFANIEALAAIHAVNRNITPSTIARRGSQISLSSHNSSASSSSFDTTSHNHHLFHSLHNLRAHWREHIWTYQTDRIERLLAVGNAASGRKVLTTEEMEVEATRGFANCLPVASSAGDAFVGWRIKGATFPRM